MQLVLDHFFILVEPEAKVASLLVELGLEESFSRDHPGQGTSNRCFSFSNSKLELLWLRDEEEANNGPAHGLKFPERSVNVFGAGSASPFGLIFNRKGPLKGNGEGSSEENGDLKMPFNGWRYQPDYFPAPMAFHVGNNSENLVEPLCIYIPFMEPAERHVDLVGEKGRFKSIKNVHIHVPVESLSPELLVASQTESLTVACGEEHLMEITFVGANNGNSCGLSKDLRPTLPLIVHW